MGELTQGEAFGEIALFDQKPRTATVVTLESSRFLVIGRRSFNQYLMTHSQVAIGDQELGEIAGIPGDVVTAQLRHWQEQGMINIHHGHLTLLEPEKLTGRV